MTLKKQQIKVTEGKPSDIEPILTPRLECAGESFDCKQNSHPHITRSTSLIKKSKFYPLIVLDGMLPHKTRHRIYNIFGNLALISAVLALAFLRLIFLR